MDETLLEIYKIANSQDNVYSKALANFLFREIIEDCHTKYKISQDDMKQMCKEVVNRAKLYLQIRNDPKLNLAFSIEAYYGREWDEPEMTEDLKKRLKFYEDVAETILPRCFVMSTIYGFDGYIFKKETDSAEIGAYFTIIQPNGKVLESNHFFSSETEIRQWVLKNRS